jgi:hypothetical protein
LITEGHLSKLEYLSNGRIRLLNSKEKNDSIHMKLYADTIKSNARFFSQISYTIGCKLMSFSCLDQDKIFTEQEVKQVNNNKVPLKIFRNFLKLLLKLK